MFFRHKVEFEIFKQIFSKNQVDECKFSRYIYEGKIGVKIQPAKIDWGILKSPEKLVRYYVWTNGFIARYNYLIEIALK